MDNENLKDILIGMVGILNEQKSVIKELSNDIQALKATKGTNTKNSDPVDPPTEKELDEIMKSMRF